MDIDEEKKQIFVATVCTICGLCRNPDPDFCALLYYNGDGEQFTRGIIKRINRLSEVSTNSLEILHTFEGFSSLFCRKDRCPLYDKQCETKLSSRITCYRSFIKQNDEQIILFNLSKIYKKWSGISLREIGRDLDPITDVPSKLTKSQRKKLKKTIKKAKKSIKYDTVGKELGWVSKFNNNCNNNKTVITYKSRKNVKQEIAKTLFFCNPNEKWKEKISQYLEKNEQHKDDNRQSSEASKSEG